MAINGAGLHVGVAAAQVGGQLWALVGWHNHLLAPGFHDVARRIERQRMYATGMTGDVNITVSFNWAREMVHVKLDGEAVVTLLATRTELSSLWGCANPEYFAQDGDSFGVW